MLKARQITLGTAVLLVVLLIGSRPAEAGPPLICHPFEAGASALLPWGDGPGWNTPDQSYEVQRLAEDTLRLLSADAPILARMENLRRAAIYASRDRRAATELLAALLERTRPGGQTESRDPLAWFDAGYLAETYRQARLIHDWDMLSGPARASWTMRSEPDVDGYAFVRRAIALAGSNPEMEFAASLMKTGAVAAGHRRRAKAGARAGSLLAANLER